MSEGQKPPKRKSSLVIILAILGGCIFLLIINFIRNGSQEVASIPTSTPIPTTTATATPPPPTATPILTDTPTPEPTDTPAPTSTPNHLATSTSELKVGLRYVPIPAKIWTGVKVYYVWDDKKTYEFEILGGSDECRSLPSGLGIYVRFPGGSEEWKDRDYIVGSGDFFVLADDPAIYKLEWDEYPCP
jgi:hypothetical protein